MFLRRLEIKNYRSLESITLENLNSFDILIGRNNSGKSSVFGTIDLLNKTIRGGTVAWPTVLTDMDSSRALEISLVFDLRAQEREDFIRLLWNSEQQEGRREAARKSPLLRQVEFLFKAPAGSPANLHLRQVSVRAEDNQMSVIQKMAGDEREGNPIRRMKLIGSVAAGRSEPIDSSLLDVDRSTAGITDIRISTNYVSQGEFINDKATLFPLTQLDSYLRKAFFFNPFRHSTPSLQSMQTDQLAQDGSNLAQVLHPIIGNDRPLFARIAKFVQAALPDVGILQAPLLGTNTEVGFRSGEGGYYVRLHDMGGGIEQLLMVATVLLTTVDECTLFIEEPESHLHAGAQRFLIEKLYQGSRQIFITTHSPTFVNLSRPSSMYQVQYSRNRTKITRFDNAEMLSAMLSDIGSRNSDVLLSDAVLFVEGPGDRGALTAWSETLGTRLEEHNVTVLPMGGGEHADRSAPIRSDVLEGISRKAPVPHQFVLDRDERRQSEIDKLQQALGDRVCLLKARELENYLLVPRALLVAIRAKCIDNASIVERIDAAHTKDVSLLIQETAESLYGLVLLKRIRAELGGLIGGLLPRDAASVLASEANSPDLPQLLQQEIEQRFKHHVSALDINGIVRAQKEALGKEWSEETRRLEVAPGEEILSTVFHHFGTQYKKPEDTVRIAKEMRADEIPNEIKQLIGKAIALTDRSMR